MNNVKNGLEIFKCATDFDYYLLEKNKVYKNTIINDYKNNIYEYKIDNNIKFIPNHSINEVMKLIDKNESCNFLNSKSVYETRKKWMSNNKIDEYKYPCIYSINSKNELSLKWSSRNNNGHFGISKFIFSNGNGYFKDINGEYGLTEWAYAFICENKTQFDIIEKIFMTKKFKDIIEAIELTSNKYNYNILKYFKEDFYKEFI